MKFVIVHGVVVNMFQPSGNGFVLCVSLCTRKRIGTIACFACNVLYLVIASASGVSVEHTVVTLLYGKTTCRLKDIVTRHLRWLQRSTWKLLFTWKGIQ